MSSSVLVVDDSLTVRMDLADAFEQSGFSVRACATIAEAREALTSRVPELVVLDVLLPDGDGVSFLEELRREAATARVPVVLLSTEAEVKARVRGLTHGADEYVGKPYDLGYVLARARELLGGGAARSEERVSVLVVDDSLTFREELGDQLREAGYRAVLAGSGEEGLRLAEAVRPNAIVVDGLMPGMDGTTVVRRIRLDPALHDTPCLLLTAAEGRESEILALDAGADAYLRKSEGVALVLAKLAAMLRAAEESRERAHRPGLLGPKRILAVDDSITYLAMLAEALRGEGYEVVQARSGEEALELLGVEAVDCILLDLVMTGLSGTETCRRIKGSPSLRAVPLIMLTVLAEPEAMIDGINAGADDYVVKSADFDLLRARLRAQLRRKQFEDEGRRVREEILHTEAEARAARALAEARSELLRRLEEKNAHLSALNRELQSFAYSVSHDLRQPLRSMDGFSQALLERYGDSLDEQGKHYLERVRAGAERMNRLIDGLLTLSRVTGVPLRLEPVRLDELARRVLGRLVEADPGREVEVSIPEALPAVGDEKLLESALENLLGNAWKFTATRRQGLIEMGAKEEGGVSTYFVRDNGVGFQPAYAHKLFVPFQRLHPADEFPGTGIGLATVQRIIHRHGGRVWADGVEGEGATFSFTLDSAAPGLERAES